MGEFKCSLDSKLLADAQQLVYVAMMEPFEREKQLCATAPDDHPDVCTPEGADKRAQSLEVGRDLRTKLGEADVPRWVFAGMANLTLGYKTMVLLMKNNGKVTAQDAQIEVARAQRIGAEMAQRGRECENADRVLQDVSTCGLTEKGRVDFARYLLVDRMVSEKLAAACAQESGQPKGSCTKSAIAAREVRNSDGEALLEQLKSPAAAREALSGIKAHAASGLEQTQASIRAGTLDKNDRGLVVHERVLQIARDVLKACTPKADDEAPKAPPKLQPQRPDPRSGVKHI